VNFIFSSSKLWCINGFKSHVYENDERYQLDAKIVIYYRKYLYMFRMSICPSSGVQVLCTAYGVQHCKR